MRKKKWFIIIAAVLILLLVFTAAIIASNRHTPHDNIQSILNRLENNLGDNWKTQIVTEVYDLVYSDEEGNTIIYYVCLTTYHNTGPEDFSELNTDAISAVIDPSEAESSHACTVSGIPAMIYQKDSRAYLCWTIMPELSCIIEYDPAVESEADMVRMAESVPANAASSTGVSEP